MSVVQASSPLIVAFLTTDLAPADALPRLWVSSDGDEAPRELGASRGERELVGALALPRVLRRRTGTVGPRTREEVLAGLHAPMSARGADLDRTLGRDASTRSRRFSQLRDRLAGLDLDVDGLVTSPEPGVVELHGGRTDLVELLDAVAAGRWADGARLLGLADGEAGAPVAPGVPAEHFRVPDVVTEPAARELLEEAVAAVAEHWAGVPEQAPARRSRRPLVVAGAVGAAGLALAVLAGVDVLGGPDRVRAMPVASAAPPQTLTVDNRVTEGMGMREDRAAVRLSSRPVPYCGALRCDIAGTARHSGGTYARAVCRTSGSYVTNGNDSSSAEAPVDDHNPALARSTGYYGVRLANGTFGFVSEVWIRREQRGGLGLPACPR